jgi:hypothetical protein
MALGEQRGHGEAEAAYRMAIDLRPEFALARLNLGSTLTEQARFDECQAIVRQGRDLLPARDPLHGAADDLLEWCRLYRAMDARHPAILCGTDRPADAEE